jgi:F-type H+-transporting ATPase subunit b
MTASFSVFLAFVVFVGLLGKKLWTTLAAALDQKTYDIQETLKTAEILKIEAEHYLAEQKKIHIEAEDHAKRIIAHAESEAENLMHEAKEKIQQFQLIQERLLEAKISRLEVQMVEEFKARLIDEAVDDARKSLKSSSSEQEKMSHLENALIKLDTLDFERMRF